MKLFGRSIAAFILISTLAGCAGTHIIPKSDYAEGSKIGALRLVLDQDGNIYPRTDKQFKWLYYPQPRTEPIFGNAFQLDELSVLPPYCGDIKKQAEEDIASQLNERLQSKSMLIVLVHGFNNEFDYAANNFSKMVDYIDPAVRARAAILEVYWDALDPRGDHLFWEITALSFWRKSLTYSNLAGVHGLRKVLGRIDKDVDVRFVTHSRGAGVVMSALADPKFDDHIKDRTAPALRNAHIKSIKIAAFAPAIGGGHLIPELDDRLASHPVELLVGFNKKDYANAKLWLIPERMYGTTSLGANRRYVHEQLAQNRKNFKLRAFEFEHGNAHHLEDYFTGNTELTRCMFSMIDLGPTKTTSCPKELPRAPI